MVGESTHDWPEPQGAKLKTTARPLPGDTSWGIFTGVVEPCQVNAFKTTHHSPSHSAPTVAWNNNNELIKKMIEKSARANFSENRNKDSI